MDKRLVLWIGGVLLGAGLSAGQCQAQSFGIELHNTLMPASGGMAGVSVARPQDSLSAINGNPATLVQFSGTQFSFGAAWADASYSIEQDASLPLVGVDPYSARSNTPGSAAPNIGVSHDLEFMGLPAVWGIGLFTNAGAGTDFRRVPASNGTSSYYMALDFTTGLGIQLTDRLAAGASLTVGSSFMDGPFVDIGGMTPAYGFRGAVGLTYDLGYETTMGAYWQSQKRLQFDDAVLFPTGDLFDLRMDHPDNVGLGIANSSLMDGRLLLAMDVLYKNYSATRFLGHIYDDQWVYQFGLQYAVNPSMRLRLGYAYNENPMAEAQAVTVGGVTLPDGVPALRYIQGQFAAVSQHCMTAGVGISNVLPAVDLDLLAGGMFRGTDEFANTTASVESYWIGSYLTWRYGCSQCQ